MTNSLYINSTNPGSGKALVALGILEMLLRKTSRVAFFRPIISQEPECIDEDIELIVNYFHLQQSLQDTYGLSYKQINELSAKHQPDTILEIIIEKYKNLEKNYDFVLCEGSDYLGKATAYEYNLNLEIAKNLGCPVLILGSVDAEGTRSYHFDLADSISPVQIAHDNYIERGCQVIGIIINKAPIERLPGLESLLRHTFPDKNYTLAVIPYDSKLKNPRISEIAQQLNAEILHGHDRLDGLAAHYLIAGMQLHNALGWLKEDTLVITPGDRSDLIVGMLQADKSANYPHLAGIILTAGFKPEKSIERLIEGLADTLPILSVTSDTYTTASLVHDVQSGLRATDHDKIALSLQLFQDYVDLSQLETRIRTARVTGITPKLFTYNLVQTAKKQKRHIVLPEGSEPRILQAAAVLLSQDIVDLTLVGNREKIASAIKKHGVNLDIDRLNIINPMESERFDFYVDTLLQLRQHKGVNRDMARDFAQDVSYFGTLMVYCGDADGMVSGAVHTTQHTIRPALQIIKTTPDCSVVSSVFFMCLHDRVLVYGDCAVNPDPNAEQLAEIAISSAVTAQRFGIEPRIALLSYSSGTSGEGEEVEKVRRATLIARQKRPDLLIEGPIQYDAAVDKEVAAQKMPDSPVAGRATVFVFPDLNTGNNTYKAVQRETNALAIGPILQGLKKPVNDLSRGCTVPDIVNTVVITAIQAQT